MNLQAKLTSDTWTNWYGNLSCKAAIVDAHTEEDVADAIRFATEQGWDLRLAGTGHSNIPLVPNSGMVIVTDNLKGLQAHDSDACTVTLAAGTKIRALGDMLWEHGLSLSNQGDIDTQSIVGALSTGTHGTGLGLTNLSARIKSLRMVGADAESFTLEDSSGDKMSAARVSMGMLGAITSVEMEVSKAYHLHEWMGFMPYAAVAEIEDEMNARYRHFGYFWLPNKKSERFISVTDIMSEDQKEFACVRIFDPDPIDVGELEKYTFRRRHDRSYRIFAEDYVPEFDEMEYMVPLDVGRECFEELVHEVRDIFHANAIPAEVRVTAGDDNMLSEFYGGPRRSISLAGPMHADNSKLFEACDAVFARYGGRTHWGKANCLTRDRLQEVYPRFGDFVAIRREMDPEGLFLNDYLRRWFE